MGEIAHADLGPFVDGEAGDVLPFEKDSPSIGVDEADGHVEGGRFAGAVGAEEADDFARLDLKGEAVDDGFAAVRLMRFFTSK